MSRVWIVIATVLAALSSAQAQHAPASSYSDLQHRPVKALSEEQIADLRAGRGMGLALSAELNGYPGPVHVLELGEKLGLTLDQRTRMQELLAAMKAETVPLGERLIEQETALNRQFATKSVTPASLQTATAEIGATQGALRRAHLHYHLSTLEVLTPEQVSRYNELRGYGISGSHGHGRTGHH
ncbi:Spy/CpxP family protein refolding chaperone [Microvirga mediterraneensis]|jgi:Spy/CpxP family protein refolding chaperone|uniref:Periplasmic heavy metal sensor n=1 Tax=Microvirga mediterraneensis TaxID=2754695 RepID=A0A838BTH5_9HYPH|nr:periplasmic heavy metal sensor [Microvirga mediterraneensis]MBA1158847.1 periplasmic heavy metal sensor [Microvirga mediterraneensis]